MTKLPDSKRTSSADNRYLTTADVCDSLGIARSTFYDWRAAHKAPPSIKLPNGALRFVSSELDAWLDGHREPA